MTDRPHTPLVLIVIDGWGHSDNLEYNAIYSARTPTWDRLWQQYPHTLLSACGEDVGLPAGQMGNSEVGHLHIGAGRQVLQDLMRISHAIEDGSFFNNAALVNAAKTAAKDNTALHILGLLSPGGVHSHEQHIQAMVKLAAEQGVNKIYVHALLDGRDTPPRSAMASLQAIDAQLQQLGHGKIASIIGRYYAMDRDQRWDRTQQAYDALTLSNAEYQAVTAEAALEMAYARGENDEFVKPTSIVNTDETAVTINDGDVVVMMNFRADRARQLTRALTDDSFNSFQRQSHPRLAGVVTLTNYASDIKAEVAFPPQRLMNSFGEYIAKQGLTQLRIAETEKYAHVTYFFNGGNETIYEHEQRLLVPSPKVATYDLQPEMSAVELTQRLVETINSKQYDVIICNYANPDMVGHTGDFDATVKAIETIDGCLKQVIDALIAIGGECLITADHGNAEKMHNLKTGQAHTAHTTEPVPFIYVGRKATFSENHNTLADVAPTMLNILDLAQPQEMTGNNLLKLCVTA